MEDHTDVLSCDPVALYGRGEIVDPEFDLGRLVDTARRFPGAVEVVAEIFPATLVRRPAPAAAFGHDPEFTAYVAGVFDRINRDHAAVSPVLLVRIRDAIVWNNMLFAVADGRIAPLYECYRPNDRGAKGERLVARLAACARRDTIDPGGRPTLFMGSAGSFNYGHWLVDDVPALACAGTLWPANARARVLISSFDYANIDAVRRDGLALALGPDREVDVLSLDQAVAYRVRDLHFVTPSSYHPLNKHPASIAYAKSLIHRSLAEDPGRSRPERIFVNRDAGWLRRLVNVEDLRAVFRGAGYEEVVPESLPLREQWATFGAAHEIVGIMGAAMASTLLSPAGARVGHLAPSGWLEPFFWDLAAMSGHRYAAAHGPDDGVGEYAYRRSFSIPPSILERLIDVLRAGPPR